MAMFRDMDRLTPAVEPTFAMVSAMWLEGALRRGEYLGWLATPTDRPAEIVAGAGVQLRQILPFPQTMPDKSVRIAEGRQAIVVNVYTEPAFRRQGAARRLMETVLEWARSVKLESLVLHAAPDGRPLYQRLGFAPTNEMRYQGTFGVDSNTTD